jgi:phospho-N-acetylmuramoyl-pentapeptide-transferase
VVAALIGYIVAHAATDDPVTVSGVLVLLLMVGLGAVGFIDDYDVVHD